MGDGGVGSGVERTARYTSCASEPATCVCALNRSSKHPARNFFRDEPYGWREVLGLRSGEPKGIIEFVLERDRQGSGMSVE